jgi:sulfur-carrier protein
MTTVRALFFARYRDLVGEGEVELPLADSLTVAELVRDLRERGEPFSRLPPDPAVAVNREVARPDTPVRPGDEVAFLPPVAGG